MPRAPNRSAMLNGGVAMIGRSQAPRDKHPRQSSPHQAEGYGTRDNESHRRIPGDGQARKPTARKPKKPAGPPICELSKCRPRRVRPRAALGTCVRLQWTLTRRPGARIYPSVAIARSLPARHHSENHRLRAVSRRATPARGSPKQAERQSPVAQESEPPGRGRDRWAVVPLPGFERRL